MHYYYHCCFFSRLHDASPDSMMKIWGPDPVHPTSEAYNTMVIKIMDEIDSEVVLNARLPSSGPATPGPDRGAGKFGQNTVRPREEWTRGSQTVADRLHNRSGHIMRGGPHRGGRRGSRGRGHPYRGRAGRRNSPISTISTVTANTLSRSV